METMMIMAQSGGAIELTGDTSWCLCGYIIMVSRVVMDFG